ncbi:MAG: hypothetical protein ORO03_04905 [Alphaproteobacteria bacterium]|nr:hypothetical protein [Alphaproteobacteria bacterium]
MSILEKAEGIAKIIAVSGGQIVGKTKLQKTIYLLTVTGLDKTFHKNDFSYYHYGPYSDDVAESATTADLFDYISEEESPSKYGSTYSVYRSKKIDRNGLTTVSNTTLVEFTKMLVNSDPIVLELAATAAYLAFEDPSKNAWEATGRHKPSKTSDENLAATKKLYAELLKVNTPIKLPEIRE